jgi:uncharacterized protein
LHLTLHLTDRCNLRCTYCYDAPHGVRDMDFDTVRAAIELAMRETPSAGAESNIGIVFYGGEPLLKRELIRQTVAHCRQVRQQTGRVFHCKVTTNGLLLDDDFLSHPDTESVFIALSHDGVPGAHDLHRVDSVGAGSHARVTHAAAWLVRKRPCTPIMMVVSPDTAPRYAESIEHLFELGFRYLIVTLDYGAPWEPADFEVLRRQYELLARWYYDATRREEKFFFSPFEVKIASHIHPTGCWQERCDLATRQVSVAPDGTLFPCVQFVGERSGPWRIGHVRDGFDAQARQRVAAIVKCEHQPCRSCGIRTRCSHHCGCANFRATGSIDRVAPAVCAHERTLLPIADRLAEKLFRKRDPLFLHKQYNDYYPFVSAVENLVPSIRARR